MNVLRDFVFIYVNSFCPPSAYFLFEFFPSFASFPNSPIKCNSFSFIVCNWYYLNRALQNDSMWCCSRSLFVYRWSVRRCYRWLKNNLNLVRSNNFIDFIDRDEFICLPFLSRLCSEVFAILYTRLKLFGVHSYKLRRVCNCIKISFYRYCEW